MDSDTDSGEFGTRLGEMLDNVQDDIPDDVRRLAELFEECAGDACSDAEDEALHADGFQVVGDLSSNQYDEGWEQLVRPGQRSKSYKGLDFTKLKYQQDASRITGKARDAVQEVGQQLGVVDGQWELFFTYMFFLLHCLLRQTGAHQICDSKHAEWQRDGLGSLTPEEEEYVGKAVPSMEAAERSRGPWAVNMFDRLVSWCKDRCLATGARFETQASTERLYQVWMHMVCICYYIGDPAFVDTVVLGSLGTLVCAFSSGTNLDSFFQWYINRLGIYFLVDVKQIRFSEDSPVQAVFVEFILGEVSTYSPVLYKQLKLYALTRETCRRWFNWCDGTRLAECKADRLAALTRLYDSLLYVHATPIWENAAAGFAVSFHRVLEHFECEGPQQPSAVRKSVRKMMHATLCFDLLGRSKYARKSSYSFLSGVHCYWGKFLFSCCCLLVRRIHVGRDELMEYVDGAFTFVGPAPRWLYATWAGRRNGRHQQRAVLGYLRILRSWVRKQFGVTHPLYNLQVNPCDWQHWIRARFPFDDVNKPRTELTTGIRGGSVSDWKSQLLNSSWREEQNIAERKAFFSHIPWVVDSWNEAM